ncbi:hypothetical protein [Nostoc sp.]
MEINIRENQDYVTADFISIGIIIATDEAPKALRITPSSVVDGAPSLL